LLQKEIVQLKPDMDIVTLVEQVNVKSSPPKSPPTRSWPTDLATISQEVKSVTVTKNTEEKITISKNVVQNFGCAPDQLKGVNESFFISLQIICNFYPKFPFFI